MKMRLIAGLFVVCILALSPILEGQIFEPCERCELSGSQARCVESGNDPSVAYQNCQPGVTCYTIFIPNFGPTTFCFASCSGDECLLA